MSRTEHLLDAGTLWPTALVFLAGLLFLNYFYLSSAVTRVQQEMAALLFLLLARTLRRAHTENGEPAA